MGGFRDAVLLPLFLIFRKSFLYAMIYKVPTSAFISADCVGNLRILQTFYFRFTKVVSHA